MLNKFVRFQLSEKTLSKHGDIMLNSMPQTSEKVGLPCFE